ncbi:hypothetical protein F5I97DRAFT_1826641 [Phlebopus sp. FC_14]|nr:hypothetical protein F5I97DRAFT_1826641 [Phlebopus sp. FC_14]
MEWWVVELEVECELEGACFCADREGVGTSDITRVREGVAGTVPLLRATAGEDTMRGKAVGGPMSDVRRPFCPGDDEEGSTPWTGTEKLEMDVLSRFVADEGIGTGVAFGERPFVLSFAETVERVEVENDGETDAEDEGFTVVHPLASLAFERARGLATLNVARALVVVVVEVDRAIDERADLENMEATSTPSRPTTTNKVPGHVANLTYIPTPTETERADFGTQRLRVCG